VTTAGGLCGAIPVPCRGHDSTSGGPANWGLRAAARSVVGRAENLGFAQYEVVNIDIDVTHGIVFGEDVVIERLDSPELSGHTGYSRGFDGWSDDRQVRMGQGLDHHSGTQQCRGGTPGGRRHFPDQVLSATTTCSGPGRRCSVS